MRANHKKDRIPYGRRSLQLAAGIFNHEDSVEQKPLPTE
jgi:hypothetical protein